MQRNDNDRQQRCSSNRARCIALHHVVLCRACRATEAGPRRRGGSRHVAGQRHVTTYIHTYITYRIHSPSICRRLYLPQLAVSSHRHTLPPPRFVTAATAAAVTADLPRVAFAPHSAVSVPKSAPNRAI